MRRRRKQPIPATRFGVVDLLDEASAGMLARPGRALLTALGTLLGVASFVAVLGLTTTASGQISARFDALVATEVQVRTGQDDPFEETSIQVDVLPWDAEQRLSRLNGVVTSGVYWSAGQGREVSALGTGVADRTEPVDVIAASPGFFDAVHATVATGRFFDAFHDDEAQPVAVVGRSLAQRLGVTDVRHHPAVYVDGVPLTVIGIVEDVDRHPEVLMGIVVPRGTAAELWGRQGSGGTSERVIIDTRLGAAGMVGEEAPLALRPEAPHTLQVTVPPDPRELRENVTTDLTGLFLALAVICLAVGTVGIANTMLVSVLERVPEIGLRRALGARRRHVAALFLTESGLLGLFGGLVGTTVGVVCVVVVALVREWTPVIAPWTVLPSPLVGALAGLLAGAYPAWRATRIEPAEALRR